MQDAVFRKWLAQVMPAYLRRQPRVSELEQALLNERGSVARTLFDMGQHWSDTCIQHRIHELEHKLCQVLDAAKELELNPPPSVEVTFLATNAQSSEAMSGKPMTLAVRPEKVRGFARCIRNNIESMGEWSTLNDVIKERNEADEMLRKLEARYARLLGWVEDMVLTGIDDTEGKFPAGHTGWRAATAAHRLGGCAAMEQTIMVGAADVEDTA